MLQISHGTVGNEQMFLRQKAKENIKTYVDQRLPEEYEKCLVGINSILREAWNTSKHENIDNKEKIHALSLAKECYSMKLDLLTNATVIDDAVRFVSEKSKQNIRVSSTSHNQVEKDSNESIYNKDADLLEEEQEHKTGKTNSTVNQDF